MNKIILIGNGFDLAHGLKTSYNDFIESIFDDIISFIHNEYECEYIEKLITFNKHYRTTKNPLSTSFPINDKQTYYIKYKELNRGKNIIENNLFLKEFLTSKNNLNWGSIENIYYTKLLEFVNNEKYTLETKNKLINILNNDFELIIRLLEKYLTKIELENNNELDDNIINVLTKKIDSKLVPLIKLKHNVRYFSSKGDYNFENRYLNYTTVFETEIIPTSTLIINFNYTKTINKYLKKINNVNVIHIHGELNNESNKIIFGFGDELDVHYNTIESIGLDNALDYIKSVKYLDNDNYKRIMDYIESDTFQIVTIGHSCNNTDRTFLNSVFEHKNCLNITNYYYKNWEKGTDNWNEYSKNVIRIFKDKKKARVIVSSKSQCEPLQKNHS